MAYENPTDLTTSLGRPKAEGRFALFQVLALGFFLFGLIGAYFGGSGFFLIGLSGYLFIKTVLAWIALAYRRRYEIYQSRAWKDWFEAIGVTGILAAFLLLVVRNSPTIESLLK